MKFPMNISVKNTAASIALAAAFCLVSCQENTPIAPDKVAVNTETATDDIIASVPKKYTLTKWGDANLTYYPDGRLKRVMHGLDYRGSNNWFTNYTYAAGSIHALTFVGNSPSWDQTYTIDVVTGRCTAYTGLKYLYSNSTLTEKTALTYTYGATGRMKTSNDKVNPAIHTDYFYNAAGDLNRVMDYAMDYNAFAVYLKSDYKFAYDQPVGDPILADLYPLNSEYAYPPDPFLPIFGKQPKHLVKLITFGPSSGGLYYNYQLNADGYVTQWQAFSLTTAALVETKKYDYLVTSIGLGL